MAKCKRLSRIVKKLRNPSSRSIQQGDKPKGSRRDRDAGEVDLPCDVDVVRKVGQCQRRTKSIASYLQEEDA
jgi:hypothetical protein